MPSDPNNNLAADEKAAEVAYGRELQDQFDRLAQMSEESKKRLEAEYNGYLGSPYSNRSRVMRPPGENPELVGDKMGKTQTQWPQIDTQRQLPGPEAPQFWPGMYFPYPGDPVVPGVVVDTAPGQGDAIKLHELRHVQANEPYRNVNVNMARYNPRDRRAIQAYQAMMQDPQHGDEHAMHNRMPVSMTATGGGTDPDPNGIKYPTRDDAKRDAELAAHVAELRAQLGLK